MARYSTCAGTHALGSHACQVALRRTAPFQPSCASQPAALVPLGRCPTQPPPPSLPAAAQANFKVCDWRFIEDLAENRDPAHAVVCSPEVRSYMGGRAAWVWRCLWCVLRSCGA